VQPWVRSRSKADVAALCLLGLSVARSMMAVTPVPTVQEAVRAARFNAQDDKGWQAVAPGVVEPRSGQIRIAGPVGGRVMEVLVTPHDKVFAGEPLLRLGDNEVRARLAAAQAQVHLRKRARDDQSASSGAAVRRSAEDSVADSETAVLEARSALDAAAAARRAGTRPDADVEQAKAALARAQERLEDRKAALRRIEAQAPLPTQAEGQLNVARRELAAARARLEKMTLRAPLDATVLQVNAKVGEWSAPSLTQPLLLLGDVSALRVRAELDEARFGEIKVGQAVMLRPVDFRGREFAGKVSFIAAIVEPGRTDARQPSDPIDANVAEVLVDLTEPSPLVAGMKVDVYFRRDKGAAD
jgi:HlyD family secretion protein